MNTETLYELITTAIHAVLVELVIKVDNEITWLNGQL